MSTQSPQSPPATSHALFARRAVLSDGAGFHVGPARILIGPRDINAVLPADHPEPGDDDVGDLLLTPAFVDAHTHVALVSLRGGLTPASTSHNVVEDVFFRVESNLTAEDVLALTRVGALECLLHGTGFVSDHYYFAPKVAQGLAEVGLAGMVAATLQDLSGPGARRWGPSLEETDALAADGALAARGIVAALGPHAVDTVSDALWGRVVTHAAATGLPIHAHVAQSIDEVRRVVARSGTTPMALLHRLGVLEHRALFAHALYVADPELALLDDRHLLIACPSSQAQFGFPSPIHRWERAGRRWALATDCAASNDSMNVAKEQRAAAALRCAGVPRLPSFERFAATGSPADADAVADARRAAWDETTTLSDPTSLLHRVWTSGADLHPDLRVGAIQPGYLANFVLWDTDHPSWWPDVDVLRSLAFGDLTPSIRQMMVAGRWITARGAHQDLARSAAWRQASIEATAARNRLFR